MSIPKIRGYVVKAADSATNTDATSHVAANTTIATATNNQRLLCAIETCLDYHIFNSIFCQ
jgi:hypothetical protein